MSETPVTADALLEQSPPDDAIELLNHFGEPTKDPVPARWQSPAELWPESVTYDPTTGILRA